ncbi:MAG TPA: hypothetical protein VEY71_08280 [Chitinophagales bacterium]|nr:hypothetical protein [Chitinophagales bacterium]
MKKFLTTACLVLTAVAGLAQTVSVAPTEREMSLGAFPALSVRMDGIEADAALEEMEDYWKDKGARTDERNDELKATEYEPKELKPTVFTLYARSSKEKDGSQVYLWAHDGVQFVAKDHPAFAHFENQLKAFAVAEMRKPYEKMLKEAERALEKTTEERVSLERDRTGWQKDIDDCNKTIQEKQSKLKDSETTVAKTADREKELQSDTQKLKQQIEGIQ